MMRPENGHCPARALFWQHLIQPWRLAKCNPDLAVGGNAGVVCIANEVFSLCKSITWLGQPLQLMLHANSMCMHAQ